nr:zinc-activated ligand-gated ion channel [Oryctolagus cuniculus]
MARRILLHLAFLGLGSIWPSVQGPNFHVLAVDLNSLLEERESTQIPKNGSAPLLVSVQVLVSNVFNVDILRYTVSYMLILRLAVVAQDGHVEINLSLTTEANCDFELLHFPRDQSHCNLSFFVFSNTVRELEFQAHARNEIVSIKREYVVSDVKTRALPQQLVPCFQLTLSLKNTALKSIIALIVPGEALLLADVCGGLLPLQAFERGTYKVTLLLSYLVFHSSLVQGLPSSSSCNPLLTHYFTVLLLLLFVSTAETVLLAGLLARGNLRAQPCPSPAPAGPPRERGNPGPGPEGAPGGGKGSGRSWAEAADRIFFFAYVASALCSQLIFAAIWIWATCESDPPPGMAVPHGGQPSF